MHAKTTYSLLTAIYVQEMSRSYSSHSFVLSQSPPIRFQYVVVSLSFFILVHFQHSVYSSSTRVCVNNKYMCSVCVFFLCFFFLSYALSILDFNIHIVCRSLLLNYKYNGKEAYNIFLEKLYQFKERHV